MARNPRKRTSAAPPLCHGVAWLASADTIFFTPQQRSFPPTQSALRGGAAWRSVSPRARLAHPAQAHSAASPGHPQRGGCPGSTGRCKTTSTLHTPTHPGRRGENKNSFRSHFIGLQRLLGQPLRLCHKVLFAGAGRSGAGQGRSRPGRGRGRDPPPAAQSRREEGGAHLRCALELPVRLVAHPGHLQLKPLLLLVHLVQAAHVEEGRTRQDRVGRDGVGQARAARAQLARARLPAAPARPLPSSAASSSPRAAQGAA